MKDETKPAVEINPSPLAQSAYGWWNASIDQAWEGKTNRGDDKYVLKFLILEGGATGRAVYCHLSLADLPRAIELVVGLKNALGIADSDPLPAITDLVGKKIRIYVAPWITFDGETRESVSDFAEVVETSTDKAEAQSEGITS